MDTTDPFHEGERALQELAGEREQVEAMGRRMVRDAMPEQHRELFSRLPFVLVGSLDRDGQPHASLLAGPPGFLRAPDPRHLTVGALPLPADPLASALRLGTQVGLLGIEPHTRRRNRLNGVVSGLGDDGFTVEVRQSYGNCPKYIQARRASWTGPRPNAVPPAGVQDMTVLDSEAATWIAGADTFYLASAYPAQPGDRAPAHGADVSHRGGKPGFVRVQRASRSRARDVLTVPDFSGNGMFNTLGNLAIHPRAGLLFIEYERGDLLQVEADAELVLDGDEVLEFAGAQRLLKLHVRSVRRLPQALALSWTEPELSPFLLDTGEWCAGGFQTRPSSLSRS